MNILFKFNMKQTDKDNIKKVKNWMFDFSKSPTLKKKTLDSMNIQSAMTLNSADAFAYIDPTLININGEPYFSSSNKIDNELFYELGQIRTNLLKETLEGTGEFFGTTSNAINYINYAENTPIELAALNSISDIEGVESLAAFNGASINLLSFMVAVEGWTDNGRAGTPFTDATCAPQKLDGVPTVGPGLTTAIQGIQNGVRYSAAQILGLWAKVIKDNINYVQSKCAGWNAWPQQVKDMAIDCAHSGQAYITSRGWVNVRTAGDAAMCCKNMPVTTHGKVVGGLVARRQAEAAICLGNPSGLTGQALNYFNSYAHPNEKLKALLHG